VEYARHPLLRGLTERARYGLRSGRAQPIRPCGAAGALMYLALFEPFDGLSPDSCRSGRMPVTAELGHKRSFMPRSSGTRERFSATVIFQAATADLSVGVASFAVPAIDADRYPSAPWP
jgi:hypothetical protein